MRTPYLDFLVPTTEAKTSIDEIRERARKAEQENEKLIKKTKQL